MKQKLILIMITAALFAAAIIIGDPYISIPLYVLAYILIGYDVLKQAFLNITHGEVFDENFLMSIATIGAFAIGEYPEAVAVMFLYQIGEYFQHRALHRSRASISELMDIRPDSANIMKDGSIIAVDPASVHVGDEFLVKPGEKVPLDGIVLEGNSSLNTSALTGESIPRDIFAGQEIISGCINLTGVLRISATKEYSESTVNTILELVENASQKKARAEQFITRFARLYTPIVCAAALLLAFVPVLLFDGNIRVWGERALSFLVVSCPCALVISVPLTFFGGIGGASREGIMIKGGNYLEALSRTDTVVFDKTGTLTQGIFSVTSIHPQEMSSEELLRLTATLESQSTHPIAKSIQKHYARPIDSSVITDVTDLQGFGISATIENHQYLIGNSTLMKNNKITLPDCPHNGVVVHVSRDQQYLGHIAIADEVKEHAKESISDLRKKGVKNIVMLTGDRIDSSKQLGSKLGLNHVFAGLLPQDKVAHVEELLKNHSKGTLVFVGDGINDAPVLARADVGVAMGAMGSDAAIEAADVVLMDDDPRKLPLAIRIARRTIAIARQNIVFALGVKLIVLALAAAGIAGMWIAVFADVGVSLIAILNATRTLHIKPVISGYEGGK